MMLTDEEIIEVIAKRMSCEVGWSEASKVFNHYGFVDVVTHLYCEKGLRGALLDAYKGELEEALQTKVLAPQLMELREDFKDWLADVPTRGGC
jgi:hypothetical protein